MTRKYSAWHYVRRITNEVVEHPSNRGHRVAALGRTFRWQLRKRLRPGPVDVPFHGLTLRCYPDSDSASNIFYFTELFDYHEMTFLQRYLRPGDGFLDIGANIGTYTLLAAALIGPDAHIDAFEPLPAVADRYRENVARNHLTGVTLHQAAVSDEAGTATFFDFGVASALAHESREPRAKIEVALTRVDQAATTGYAFAKLDVEGVELAALRGSQRLIDAFDPPVWQIELLDHQLRKFGTSSAELFQWMVDHGFTPADYDADANALHVASVIDPAIRNYWFIATDHLDAVAARLGATVVQPKATADS